MSLEHLFEKSPAPTPVKIGGLYELLDAFAPHRAQWEEAQEQEKAAYAAYARELKQIQARCPHPVVVEYTSPRDEPLETDTHYRTCLACSVSDQTPSFRYWEPKTYKVITNPHARIRAGTSQEYHDTKRQAPLSPPVIRKILRAAKERTNVDIEALMAQWRKRQKA